MKLRILFVFVVFVTFTPLSANGNTYRTGVWFDTTIALDVLKDTTLSVPQDLYNITVTPFTDPIPTLATLGVIGGLVLVDYPTTSLYQAYVEKPLDIYSLPTLFVESPITHGADSWIVFGAMGHYLMGVVAGDEQSQVASALAGKAIAYSYLTSHVLLKALTGRNRPMDNLGYTQTTTSSFTTNPLDFGNWHPPYWDSSPYGTSMPSFHLTMYFSVAQVYAEIYDNYWLPYLGLAFIFMSDITGHNHWVSDMVAGGVVGAFIGHQVVNSYHQTKRNQNNKLSIVPTLNGVVLNYRL